MLLYLVQVFSQYQSDLLVFKYVTLRAILAALTSLGVSWLLGSKTIKLLQQLKLKQSIRSDGPSSHFEKSGTPTMGGILILFSIIVSSLLWCDLSNPNIWLVLFVVTGFALIGLVDDWLKIKNNSSQGLRVKSKYFLLSAVAIVAILWLYTQQPAYQPWVLLIPYTKDVLINIGWGAIILGYFVLVGSANAVNLTDGLDGLAILPTVLIASALCVFAYVSGHFYFSDYLSIPYIAGNAEMAIFCCAMIGAGLGFLWFNSYPAQVFMGDVGSLSLGGALGIIAILVKQELIFLIMSGVFVAETLSVILQVGSYKLRGKRIFRMAPLHHHFELKGWAEPKIIVRFWIITLLLVLIGLASLKIR